MRSISLVDKVVDEHIEHISSQELIVIIDPLKNFILLHIIHTTCIVHLINDKLLNVVGIKFWVRLDSQHPVVNSPDLIVSSVRVA